MALPEFSVLADFQFISVPTTISQSTLISGRDSVSVSVPTVAARHGHMISHKLHYILFRLALDKIKHEVPV